MQTASLPSSTCDLLDRMNRNFLWGSTEDSRRVHLMSWEDVCLPKPKGGLGLRAARKQNTSYMMKLGWKLITRKEDFWARVVRDKYKCGQDLIPTIDQTRVGSNVWKGIRNSWAKVQDGLNMAREGTTTWKWSKSGEFSVKSAYESLLPPSPPIDPLWGKIWRLRIPERCRMFLWLVGHGRLLTNVSRRKRGMSSEETCTICHNGAENLLHVLRDCHNTKILWKELVHPSAWRKFSSLDCNAWLRWNLLSNNTKEEEDWRSTFAISCWWIWKRRNTFIFQQKRISNAMVIASVRAMTISGHEAQQKFSRGREGLIKRDTQNGGWVLPKDGWIKANVDGAFSHQTNAAASGGILRDSKGNFVQGFIYRLADGDALTAELWGCVHGLKLAWDLGHRQVILESDSLEAITLVTGAGNETHADFTIIQEARALFQRDWMVCVQHTSRWNNRAADYLAKEGLEAFPGFHSIGHVTQGLERVLSNDRG